MNTQTIKPYVIGLNLEERNSVFGIIDTRGEIKATTDRPSLLREMNADDITSLDVSIAAGKGDELALEIYKFTGNLLGEECANFSAFSNPELFIFFGGQTKAGELIMNPIRNGFNNHVLPLFRNKPQFLLNGLDGSSATVLGTSAIGWEIQK